MLAEFNCKIKYSAQFALRSVLAIWCQFAMKENFHCESSDDIRGSNNLCNLDKKKTLLGFFSSDKIACNKEKAIINI